MAIYHQYHTIIQKLVPNVFTTVDVERALTTDYVSLYDFAALLSPVAKPFLKQMAIRAQEKTRNQFGNTIQLFTPLYLSNYCDNQCTYCGFNCKNSVDRIKLNSDQINKELQSIKKTGLRDILLLTGESPRHTPIEYIQQAIEESKRHFDVVGLEIMPLDTDDYFKLHKAGADFVSVYQETYNETRYKEVHLRGKKRDFLYRFNAQERALKGGMHGVSFGALFGLGEAYYDALSVGIHAYLIQQKYPHSEIGFSVPRMRPIHSTDTALNNPKYIGEEMLFQIMLALRLLMPSASITVSTRESAYFRNNVCQYVANRLSADAKVTVGGHVDEGLSDVQFEIADNRTVPEMVESLYALNLQPIFSNHIHLEPQ